MLGQVKEVRNSQALFSVPRGQSLSYPQQFRAFESALGISDHEYQRRKRPRRRLSKNPWTLHRPHPRARHRLRTLVPVT